MMSLLSVRTEMKHLPDTAAAILIVDLPTWFDDEQENDNTDDDNHADRDQECLHD
jgi:hypothetical protein